MNKKIKKPDLQQESFRENPFRVPEGYFESFPGRLKEQIGKQEDKEVPKLRDTLLCIKKGVDRLADKQPWTKERISEEYKVETEQ